MKLKLIALLLLPAFIILILGCSGAISTVSDEIDREGQESELLEAIE
jgi:hypothetical protein